MSSFLWGVDIANAPALGSLPFERSFQSFSKKEATLSGTHIRGRRGWGWLATLAGLAILTGCGSGSGSSSSSGTHTGPVNLAFFGYGANNTYTQEDYQASLADAKAAGATLTFFDGKFSGPIQDNQIIDAATSGKYQGFLILPNDVGGVVPAVKFAISKGIKVIALHFQIGGKYTTDPQVPGLTSCICASYTAGAAAVANEVVSVCAGKDPCNVVNFYGNKEQSWEVPRRTTYNGVIDQHPNIKLLAEPDAGFDTGMAYTAMLNILQAHPHIDVVSSPSADQMITGAQQALVHDGYKVGLANGGVALIGQSSDYQGVAAVRDGTWVATYINCPQTCEAKYGIKYVIEAIQGKTVPQVVYEDAAPNAIWGPNDGCGGAMVTTAFLKLCPNFTGEYEG